MDLKVVTIDFWGTLYHHRGTREYRKTVRTELLSKFLRSINYDDSLNISETFYEVINIFVESRWDTGIAPSREDILDHSYEYYEKRVPREILNGLLDEVYRIYSGELQPILTENGEETLLILGVYEEKHRKLIGSSVMAINGIAMERIKENMKVFRGANGASENFLLELMERSGIDTGETLEEAISKIPSATEIILEFLEKVRENGIRNVIVDLRENTGGNSYLAWLSPTSAVIRIPLFPSTASPFGLAPVSNLFSTGIQGDCKG